MIEIFTRNLYLIINCNFVGSLIITIIEVNHFAPTFARPWTREDPQYSIEMQEEQPTGAIVGAFTATDADNSIAGYTIEPPSPYVNINNVTGNYLSNLFNIQLLLMG